MLAVVYHSIYKLGNQAEAFFEMSYLHLLTCSLENFLKNFFFLFYKMSLIYVHINHRLVEKLNCASIITVRLQKD